MDSKKNETGDAFNMGLSMGDTNQRMTKNPNAPPVMNMGFSMGDTNQRMTKDPNPPPMMMNMGFNPSDGPDMGLSMGDSN